MRIKVIAALAWQIIWAIISLVLAPIGVIVAVIGVARRRDARELQRVGIGASAGGLAQLVLLATYSSPREALQTILVGTVFGALLVVAIEWIGYVVAGLLAVIDWVGRRRGLPGLLRYSRLELIIWGAVVGGLAAAVSAEMNRTEIDFVRALTSGGIVGGGVGALGEYLRREA